MLRVLQVVSSLAPRYGGVAQVAQDQCRELARRGFAVELYTTTQDGPRQLRVPIEVPVGHDGYQVTHFGMTGAPILGISCALRSALGRRISAFDIVHVHALYSYVVLVACSTARDQEVPYVIQPHGILGRQIRKQHPRRKALYSMVFERRNLNNASAIVYGSESEKEESEETAITAPGWVVPNGVDLSLYEPDRAGDMLPAGIPRGLPLLTFLGRLAPVKALDTLVVAFSQVLKSGHRMQLVLAGPDSRGMRSRLESLADDLGVREHVTFAGTLEGQPKVALLRRSSIFVMPSLQESFGVAVAEALAAGIPVVVSRGVAIHPAIESAHAGIVVDATADSISGAIIHLLENEAEMQSMKSAAIVCARQFSFDTMGQRLEQVYRQAVLTTV